MLKFSRNLIRQCGIREIHKSDYLTAKPCICLVKVFFQFIYKLKSHVTFKIWISILISGQNCVAFLAIFVWWRANADTECTWKNAVNIEQQDGFNINTLITLRINIWNNYQAKQRQGPQNRIFMQEGPSLLTAPQALHVISYWHMLTSKVEQNGNLTTIMLLYQGER